MAQTGVVSWSTSTGTSNGASDSNVNWAEGMAPAAVNDSARNQMASTAMWRDDISGKLVAGGTSTAYSITSNQTFSTLGYLSGQHLSFSVLTTNGSAATLNVDTLGAKALQIDSTTALQPGYFKVGGRYDVSYNSTGGYFIVHGSAGAVVTSTISTSGTANVGGVLTAASVTTGAITAASISTSGTAFFGNTVTAAGALVVTSGFQVNGGGVAFPAGSIANAALAAPGGVVRISSVTTSGTSSVGITSGLDSTYRAYRFEIDNLVPGTDSVDMYLQFSTTGGSTWITTSYINQLMAVSGDATGARAQNTSLIPLVGTTASNVTASGGVSGVVTLFNPAGTTHNKTAVVQTASTRPSGGGVEINHGGGQYTGSQAAINAVRFVCGSGVLSSGRVTLYGLTTS